MCSCFPGIKPALHKLTAGDCYELGVLAYRNDKYVRMLEWLEQAERLRVLNITDGKIDRVGNLSSVLLFEHLSWAYYLVSHFYCLCGGIRSPTLIILFPFTRMHVHKFTRFNFSEKCFSETNFAGFLIIRMFFLTRDIVLINISSKVKFL